MDPAEWWYRAGMGRKQLAIGVVALGAVFAVAVGWFLPPDRATLPRATVLSGAIGVGLLLLREKPDPMKSIGPCVPYALIALSGLFLLAQLLGMGP
jgi:hypothetical protein